MRIFAAGLVQGVSYRASFYDQAVRLGIRGWVRNRKDGRVEALVEGDKRAIDELVTWSKVGPPGANVTGVTVEVDITTEELDGFEVRPTT